MKDCLILGSTPAREAAIHIDGDGEDLFGSAPSKFPSLFIRRRFKDYLIS